MKSLELVRRWPRPDAATVRHLREQPNPYVALVQRLHRGTASRTD